MNLNPRHETLVFAEKTRNVLIRRIRTIAVLCLTSYKTEKEYWSN